MRFVMKKLKPLLSLCLRPVSLRPVSYTRRGKAAQILVNTARSNIIQLQESQNPLPDAINRMVESLIELYYEDKKVHTEFFDLRVEWYNVFKLLSHIKEITPRNLFIIQRNNQILASE